MQPRKPPSTAKALMQARGGHFGDKVYVCSEGVRHWVPSVDRLKAYGIQWPTDLKQVPDEVLGTYRIGGWLPTVFEAEQEPARINSSVTMREYLASGLSGVGLEVGAGAAPFPVPLGCTVLYGDRIPHEQLVADRYPGQSEYDLVRPDFLTDFGSFAGVAAESMDFVIGCHVIEHVFDPIGSIVNSYRVLKPGGTLLLVVPDKSRTFDRERPVTELEHLILDHRQPSAERDRMHYDEFYTLAFKTEQDKRAEKVDTEFRRRGDLHVHVWDFEGFGEVVTWVQEHEAQWSEIKGYRTLADQTHDIEFYYVLRK